jgi:dolichol-phosphate mannosyltransferase
MDSDFNHDPQVVPMLVKYLADFELVSGSRFAPGGGMYSRWRQVGSFLMNLFARVVLQTQIQDNLSGYFAVRREVLEALPAPRIFFGYGDYYFRLLFHAQRRGTRILEVPVVYRSREGGGSKTPLLRTSLRYGFEILRLRVSTLVRPEQGPGS